MDATLTQLVQEIVDLTVKLQAAMQQVESLKSALAKAREE